MIPKAMLSKTYKTTPISLAKEPVSLAKEPVSLAKEPVSLAKELVSLAKEPVSLAKEPPQQDDCKFTNDYIRLHNSWMFSGKYG